MKPAGKREKGRRLELRFAKLLRRSGLDKGARRRPFSGGVWGVMGRGDIITRLPFSFECKNTERLSLWKFWEQAEEQASPSRPPVLIYSSNYRPIMAIMKADTFLEILKEIKELKERLDKTI